MRTKSLAGVGLGVVGRARRARRNRQRLADLLHSIRRPRRGRPTNFAICGAFVCRESVDCPPTFMSTKGKLSNRANFVFLQRGGDSGYPSFILVGNQLVLLGMRWMVALGTDRSIDSNIFKYSSEIQQLMDATAPGCSLNLFDWSGYVQPQEGD